MHRISILAAAASALLLGAPAAQAQTAGYYNAVAAEAPAKATFVARTTIWSCTGESCIAKKAPERDETVCERIAQRVGPLSAFAAGGAAFDADALAKCNQKAR